jgi:DNA polymerase-3 subunit gamma/tau
MIAAMGLAGMTKQLAEHCTVLSQQEDRIALALDAGFSNMLSPKWEQGLQQALSRYFGREIRLALEVAEAVAATPKQLREAEQQTRQQQAEQSIENDPQLRSLMEQFDAGLIPDSIQPL